MLEGRHRLLSVVVMLNARPRNVFCKNLGLNDARDPQALLASDKLCMLLDVAGVSQAVPSDRGRNPTPRTINEAMTARDYAMRDLTMS
jgi:hypothetical protein